MTKKLAAVCLTGCMVLGTTACGNSSGSSDENYTMWIYSSVDSGYYDDYRKNPAVEYVLDKTWGPENKKIDFEFWAPVMGSEQDNFQTMISSGDYPDVINGIIADAAPILYGEEIILDLTDYVHEYMPNYMSYIESHPEFEPYVTYDIDGEKKILSITCAFDDYDYYFCGYQYRRDWIVKYGTNPQTGEAFSGGYTDPADVDSWEDNVIFPSGGTDPVYISDWEWMFEIFEKAYADLGINDTYCISMYYPGFTWNGDLCSSFGGGTALWYKGEDGQVKFGADQEHMRAYLQCLNTWYNNGWLDPEFNERTSDVHYAIDDVSVRQGKVGMWMGLQSELGGRLDSDDAYTDGICVYGCALPINDIYGTDACKNVEPNCVSGYSLVGTPYYITTNASEKDIATLCSFFDYFYSEEGALLRSIGLNSDQVAECESSFYNDWNLTSGAYSIGEDGRYLLDPVLQNDNASLKEASYAGQLPGITIVENLDRGYADSYENSLQKWTQYTNTASFTGTAVTQNMSVDDTNELANLQTKLLGYLEQKAPEFIKGVTDPFDDSDWDVWCTMLKKYNYERGIEICQPYVDKYPF